MMMMVMMERYLGTIKKITETFIDTSKKGVGIEIKMISEN
jgi:hypothetical protein